MMPWYPVDTLEMQSEDMEWLQQQDSASCAVWHWLKGDCVQRGTNEIRDLTEVQIETISKRLGIDSPRFSQILHNLQKIKWVWEKKIKGVPKSVLTRTRDQDALRKKVEYWRKKTAIFEGKSGFSQDSPNDLPSLPPLPDSPKTSPRGEEIRREENIYIPLPPSGEERELGLQGERKAPELVYAEYPRKEGKPAALKAIRKALARVSCETLLELTKKFARAQEGRDPRFIPHPATWFNGERYNDDPALWASWRGKDVGGIDPITGLKRKVA